MMDGKRNRCRPFTRKGSTAARHVHTRISSAEINNSTGISSNLGLEAFRIPGEQARPSNVIQFQE